jgi:hypothetical protein
MNVSSNVTVRKVVTKILSELKCSLRGYHKVSVYDHKCLDCGYIKEKKLD